MLLWLKLFLKNINETSLSLLRVFFLSKWFVKIPKNRNEKPVVILGNGPSFNSDIAKYESFLLDKELICVNHFPSTAYFTKLKPNYFIITAPDLWLDDIDQKFIDGSNRLFRDLAEKTDWELIFFVPAEAMKHQRWQVIFKSNSNIKLKIFNNIGVEGFSWFQRFMFNRNLGMPRPHNIMIPSLMMSIAMGYKTIYLWGADHSWLSEINVNDHNVVLLNQKHFYDEQTSVAEPLDKRGKGQRKLHEVLHKFMTAFKGYFSIKEYADVKGVKIINTTKGSFIDAFEKLSLEELNKD